MLIAILNGAARDTLLARRLGDPVAPALSCLMLAALIVLVTLVLVATAIAPALVFHAGEILDRDTEISSPAPDDTPRR